MKVLHIATGLNCGGAENMLYRLLVEWQRSDPSIESTVVCLVPLGSIGRRIEELGIPVHDLSMSRRFPSPVKLLRLIRIVRTFRPDIVKTWMYHANLVGALVKMVRPVPIVWSLHHATVSSDSLSTRTRGVVSVGARCSRWIPSAITSVSEGGRQVHIDCGYAPERVLVIPNGFDLNVFQADARAREELRSELNVPSTIPLVGIVARIHPDKGHATFLAAAERIAQSTAARFLFCGEGATTTNVTLWAEIERRGLAKVCHLIGPRNDMPRVYAALDVVVSASNTEAFPLAVGEAMACEVPCVVTDVGDSAVLVGDTGIVVAAAQPEALATAIAHLATLPEEKRMDLGRRARSRIVDKFDITVTAERYRQLFIRLVETDRGSPKVLSSVRLRVSPLQQ